MEEVKLGFKGLYLLINYLFIQFLAYRFPDC
jgi:hypothetical protein